MAWKFYVAPKAELDRLNVAGLPRGAGDVTRRHFPLWESEDGRTHALQVRDEDDKALDALVKHGAWQSSERSAVKTARQESLPGTWNRKEAA